MITEKEAAIITAYTGILLGKFENYHKYIEEKMGRPVFTHEMADEEVWKQIKEVSKEDFIKIKVGEL